MLQVRHAAPKAPPDDMWRPHAERLQARVSTLEQQLLQRQDIPLPTWPSKRSITVILTVHNRREMGLEAFQSILNAGFTKDQILILESGPATLGGIARTVRCDRSWGNNRCWLHAVESCDSSHVIFLHDDDLMARGLSERLQEREDWDAAVWDAAFLDNGSIRQGSSYFRCKDGVYHGRLVQDVALRLKLTISTIQGCLPRSYVADVFREWDARYSRPEFHTKPTMAVGNDLLLWLMADRLQKVWAGIGEYSICRQHPESTTLAGLSDGSIEPMYAGVRSIFGKTPTKVFQVCHLFGNGSHDRFLSNLDQNRPHQPVEFLAHRPIPGRTIRTIPNYEKGNMTDPKSRYGAANCVFTEAAKMVEQEGFDAMLYLETDCRFQGEGWDEVLRQEFMGSGPLPRCVGSPVCWAAFTGGHKQSMALIDYAARYQKDTGRMMAFEGSTDTSIFSLYPNGAIAYYSPEILSEAYLDGSRRSGLEKHSRATEPYDLHIGRIIGARGHEYATQAVGWLRSSYSGCLDHHYTLSDRLSMLASKNVVACHQVK